jgi:hypothetical protein
MEGKTLLRSVHTLDLTVRFYTVFVETEKAYDPCAFSAAKANQYFKLAKRTLKLDFQIGRAN